MEIIRLDDYQAWLLALDGDDGRRRHVLVDPWLSPRFCVAWPWLFGREHQAWVEVEGLPEIDAVLLSAHFADHCDLDTLARLDPSVPIFTTKTAARLLRRHGRGGVEVLTADQRRELGPGITVDTVRPGFPYAHNSLGFLVFERASARKLYVETHVTDERRLAQLRASHGDVDVVIAPVESVRLFGVAFAMAAPRALRSLELLGARWVLPTGLDPQRSHGLLRRLLRCRGDVEQFQAALRERSRDGGGVAGQIELVELAPGCGFVVPASASASPPAAARLTPTIATRLPLTRARALAPA